MSWIGDTPRTAIWKCVRCDRLQTQEIIPKDIDNGNGWKADKPCPDCGSNSEYIRILPMKLHIRSMVAIEHNGRRGYISTDGNGKPTYVSATKAHYLRTGNIKPQYTRGYEDHLIKNGYGDMLKETTRDEIIDARKKRAEISKRVTKVDTVEE